MPMQNEVGGARLMQERYGARIVMGAGDWDMVDQSVNGFPNGKPKRDIVATDGMKITLGGRTVDHISDARPYARDDFRNLPGA